MSDSNVQSVLPVTGIGAAPLPMRRPSRWVPMILLAVSLTLLAISVWVDPDPTGMGTHTHLGLPPCGFLQMTGLPCATCGMTTAFSLAAHGQLIQAFIAQPAGAVLALGTAMTALICGYSLLTGASLAPVGKMLGRSGLLWSGVLVLLGAWVYKILTVILSR